MDQPYAASRLGVEATRLAPGRHLLGEHSHRVVASAVTFPTGQAAIGPGQHERRHSVLHGAGEEVRKAEVGVVGGRRAAAVQDQADRQPRAVAQTRRHRRPQTDLPTASSGPDPLKADLARRRGRNDTVRPEVREPVPQLSRDGDDPRGRTDAAQCGQRQGTRTADQERAPARVGHHRVRLVAVARRGRTKAEWCAFVRPPRAQPGSSALRGVRIATAISAMAATRKTAEARKARSAP